MSSNSSFARRNARRQGTLLCLTMCGLAIGLCVSEARAVTFTVSNTNDAGAGSLRQAILNANDVTGSDFIDATGVSGTITLASALPDLSDIVLSGPNSGDLRVSGEGAVRVFNIPNANVVIGNLSVLNGVAINGGGINNGLGRLTLLGVTLNSNRATGVAATNGGGALYSTGPVVARDSSFTGNSATGDAGSGGAIFVAGSSLELRNCSVDNNTARRAGGGIETRDGARVTIVGGQMASNNTGIAPGNGGALHMTGADIVSISGTQILLNNASSEGGGLWNSATGSLTVADSTLNTNIASGADADNGGGAIYSDGGTTTVRNSIFQSNRAIGTAGSGGAILNKGSLNIIGGSISQSLARRAGGGIETVGGRVILNGVSIFSNIVAGDTPDLSGNGSALHAGGEANVFVAGGSVSNNTAALEGGGLWNSGSGVMRVDGTRFDGNVAAGAGADDGGGALYNDGGTVSVRNSTISNNRASGAAGSGGGVLNVGGRLELISSSVTGNAANRAGGGIESADATTNTFTNSTFSNNIAGPSGVAAPGNGGAFHATGAAITTVVRGSVSNNTAASEGGGLWNSATGTMIVDGTQFSENRALGGEADNGGGAIYGDGGKITVRNATLSTNRATGTAGSGGGILNKGGALEVRNSAFTGNASNRAGGAIETAGAGGLAVVNSNFTNNVTGAPGANPGNGGAIHLSGADNAFIAGGTFTGNSAANEGGALWNQAGATMTVQDATLRGNIALGALADAGGGGIYNNGGTLNLRSTTLVSNRADQGSGSGGGIFNDGGTVTINAGTLTNNIANRAGGGIETLGGRVNLIGVALTRNATGAGNGPGNGGGLHTTEAGSVFVVRGEVSDNTAAAEGGGLWNSGAGTLVVEGTLIRGNSANGTGSADATVAQDAGGGGVYNDGGALTIRNATVELNVTAGDSPGEGGGGVFNKGTANIVGTIFRGNTAINGAGNGGAILSSGPLVLNGGNLTNNKAARAGGAIENIGSINIQNATLDNNTAGVNGGALHTSGTGRAFVLASTVSKNTAQGEGGGLWNSAAGVLAVRNSTVDGNIANGNDSTQGGGGIYNDGGTVSLDSATVTGNSAPIFGGGIRSIGGTVNSINSVIALNSSAIATNEPTTDVSGAFNSQGFNLIGIASGRAMRSGDLFGTDANPLDPQLDELASNGGPTQTRLPQSGSPVIDAGNTSVMTDQRANIRPAGARKDIGAVEIGGIILTPAAKASQSGQTKSPSGGNS